MVTRVMTASQGRWWAAVLGLVLGVWVWIAPVGQGAIAADLAQGTKVFANNCAACHMGGGNVVNPAKTLKLSDLEKYGMNAVEAIQTQVTNGKNAMPAFRGRLTAEDIEAVATYVLAQAEGGW